MFRHPRKIFPTGTFIPTRQRSMAIAQLCLASSLLLWYIFQPFMGEYFTLRSRMLLYEYAMGTSTILKARADQEAKLERQMQRFKQLPEEERQLLEQDYRGIQSYAQRSALSKILDGVRVFIQDIPPFEQAWMFFSITIAILILLKIQGAQQAAWLIPLIVLAYTVDNQLTGKPPYPSPGHQLFPTEAVIIQHYLSEPLAATPLQQKLQLEKGWKLYLIANWSSSSSVLTEEENIEEAEFNFTLARLHVLHSQPRSEWLRNFHERLGVISLVSYFLWNMLFAWLVSRPFLPSSLCEKKETIEFSIS